MNFLKKFRLTLKFTIFLTCFTAVTLALTSLLSYINQTHIYQSQHEERIQYLTSYIEKSVLNHGEDFLRMREYLVAHHDELEEPAHFHKNPAEQSRLFYEGLLAKNHPGKTLGLNIQFDELAEEVKSAYALYYYEYFRLMLENSNEAFHLAYSCYIFPLDDGGGSKWLALGAGKAENEKSSGLFLFDNTPDSEDNACKFLSEAWATAKSPGGHGIYDNGRRKVHAYYSPLLINGEKLGLIAFGVEIDNVNKKIAKATLRQTLMTGAVLVALTVLHLLLIRFHHIRRLIKIQNVIDRFALEKDSELAEELKKEISNEDEISKIMEKLSDMIYELELYMYNFKKTKRDLQDTRQQTLELNELAMKDSLTGIRNKNGFDKELQKIEWEMADALNELGIALIDLNFLKRINETYGKERGNMIIVSLSRIVCDVFAHSPVFRIDDDEFAVILKGHDLKNIDDLIQKFHESLKKLNDSPDSAYEEKISAAIGYAVFNPRLDDDFESILRRANAEIYKMKKSMRAAHEN